MKKVQLDWLPLKLKIFFKNMKSKRHQSFTSQGHRSIRMCVTQSRHSVTLHPGNPKRQVGKIIRIKCCQVFSVTYLRIFVELKIDELFHVGRKCKWWIRCAILRNQHIRHMCLFPMVQESIICCPKEYSSRTGRQHWKTILTLWCHLALFSRNSHGTGRRCMCYFLLFN